MSADKDLRQQAKKLREQIEHHNYQYYVLDDPQIPDSEFDRLFRTLQALEAEHPELITLDSPTQRVGGVPLSAFDEVRHRVPMLSLDNALTPEAMTEFDRRFPIRVRDLAAMGAWRGYGHQTGLGSAGRERVNAAMEQAGVQHIADRRLERIGLPVQYGSSNPFPWMSETMDLAKEKNFFETRVTEYQTGGALSWD